MNAIKFIQQHGIDKAREVVDGAPEWASYFDGYLYSENWFHGNSILISEINNLINSIDLINHMGGIAEIKRKFRDNGSLHGNRLKQAIADYESIYGGEHV